jgi:acetylornithine deacetylase/succinyl-diaminopimelate desuccinylase-like protein
MRIAKFLVTWRRPAFCAWLACSCLAAGSAVAHADGFSPPVTLTPHQQFAEDLLRELVEFESTIDHPEQTRQALEAISNRLRQAGFPATDIQLVNPFAATWGLVARYRGLATQGPLLTMAHVDVVTADPDAWAFPPFSFGKREGYYFGRGTQDNKTGIAHILASFIRLHSEGYVPNRDLILLVTGDEETQQKVAAWIATEGRALIDADFALNSDGGGGELDQDGMPRAFWVQTSEKRYHTFRLSTSNPGGHSSLPRPDNAIYQLARALARLADHSFPVELNESTRMMLERFSRLEEGERAEDMRAVAESTDESAAQRLSRQPFYSAILRTTCTATGVQGGHAENALPRQASATVNCRILPGRSPQEVQRVLESIVNDPAVKFETIYESVASPPSPMPAALLESLETLVEESWPGVPVIPQMSTGTTDGLFLRNAGIPVYGVAGWFIKPTEIRAHGLDEKIGIREFHEGAEFWYRMLRELSQ